MNALTLFQGKQVANLNEAGAVAAPMTPAVKQAMRELVVCYTAPGETTEDRALVLQVWARETASYLPEIVTEALHTLLRENPRAPFRPCIKDVIRYCDNAQSKCERIIADWYRGRSDDEPPRWAQPLVRGVLEQQLQEISQFTDLPSEYEMTLDMFWSISPRQARGWASAKKVGPRIADWPHDLLDQHRVPHGDELRRIGELVARQEAEQTNEIRSEWYDAVYRSRRSVDLSLRFTAPHARAAWGEIARCPNLYPTLSKDPRAKLIEEAA